MSPPQQRDMRQETKCCFVFTSVLYNIIRNRSKSELSTTFVYQYMINIDILSLSHSLTPYNILITFFCCCCCYFSILFNLKIYFSSIRRVVLKESLSLCEALSGFCVIYLFILLCVLSEVLSLH